MEVVIPRFQRETAPLVRGGQRYAPLFPESIGMLAQSEAAGFSRDFSWDEVATEGYALGQRGETVHLGFTTGVPDGPHRYMIPDGLEQFVPVIRRIGEYERNRFPRDTPWGIKLTVRQSTIHAGTNQHTVDRPHVHRDGPFGSWDRFYVVADNNPTQFFARLYMKSTLLELETGGTRPDSVPLPYEIMGASTSMFHRSPAVRHDTLRTFLRLTYKYAEKTP